MTGTIAVTSKGKKLTVTYDDDLPWSEVNTIINDACDTAKVLRGEKTDIDLPALSLALAKRAVTGPTDCIEGKFTDVLGFKAVNQILTEINEAYALSDFLLANSAGSKIKPEDS